MTKLVLCADSESLRQPALIGLEGEVLEDLSWLTVYASAPEARAGIADSAKAEEIWVLSSDQMDAINLAAAIKRDRPELRVFLVSSQISGSSLSRAQAAGLDGTLSPRAFALRYAQEKRRYAQSADATMAAAVVAAGRPGAADGSAAAGRPGAADGSSGSSIVVPAPVGFVDDVCEEDFLSDEELSPSAFDESLRLLGQALPQPAPRSDELTGAEGNVRVGGGSGVQESMREGLRTGARASARASAFSLCVMGAGGGVGTTAVSLVIAHILARRGMSVLLIDADLCLGGLAGASEAHAVLSLSEAIDKPESLESLVAAGKLTCIAAPERMELADRLSESLPELVDRASLLFDAVVIDVGGSFSGLHLDLAERCTQSLLLVGQRSSSVRACKRIVDMFQRCGAATNSLVFAINRCSKGSIFSSIDVSCLLQGSRVRELRDGGRIVEELVGIGAASSLIADGNSFAMSLGHLLQELLPESAGATSRQTKSSPIRLLGEGLRARRSQRDQKRGEFREHDAA